jgi:hypothetical protein
MDVVIVNPTRIDMMQQTLMRIIHAAMMAIQEKTQSYVK